MGKSTLTASVMDDPRWTPCHYYDYDESRPSIAKYFGDGGPGVHIEVQPGDWSDLMRHMDETERAAAAGECNAMVWDGFSAYYRDDLGLEAAANPDKVQAGGNVAMKLRVAPSQRLGAMLAKMRRIKAVAKSPDFIVIVTAHSKEIGDVNSRSLVPDMSANAWQQLFRLAPVVMRLDRFSGQPPSLIFEDIRSEFHRIKDPNALAYIRAIQHDAAKMAKMRTIPGLVGLLEHGEKKAAAKFAADHAPKPPAAEPAPTTST